MHHPFIDERLAADRQSTLIADAERHRAARPQRRRRLVPAAILAGALAAVALPSAAQAGTATVSGGVLFYSDASAAHQSNTVAVRSANGKLILSDTGPITDSASQCRVFNGELECDSSVASVSLSLGDGDDTVRYRTPKPGFVSVGGGNNRVMGGIRESAGQTIGEVVYFGLNGTPSYDRVDYSEASSGVSVEMADNLANDGRPGDRENIRGFEAVVGSNFRDVLWGTPGPDAITGGPERDLIAGGHGDDVFYSGVRDGADDYHGGPGRDSILYIGRTAPLTVKLDNVATDGEAGEFDNVQTNVEQVYGGSGDDVLSSFGSASRLEGLAGNDTLTGGNGPDTLIGGPGIDSHTAGGGNDVVDARDGDPDFVDCGTETDTASRDVSEGIVRNCETVAVGVLRLGAKAMRAEAGETTNVKLSWAHPDGWRRLKAVTVRVTDAGAPVGEIVIRPRGGKIEADGVIRIVRRATKLAHRGKTVHADLGVRINAAMAGKTLGVEVEATDTRGRRQLERSAGTIRVAR